MEGLAQRLKERPSSIPELAYQIRLKEEIAVICSMGFAGYFLIVWDIIKFARSRGIPVGPGRGSAAGSLVAYALRITDLDPLVYSLLFERFLNPERVSLPDIDMDFCMDRRDEVINYVIHKYGEDHVARPGLRRLDDDDGLAVVVLLETADFRRGVPRPLREKGP